MITQGQKEHRILKNHTTMLFPTCTPIRVNTTSWPLLTDHQKDTKPTDYGRPDPELQDLEKTNLQVVGQENKDMAGGC